MSYLSTALLNVSRLDLRTPPPRNLTRLMITLTVISSLWLALTSLMTSPTYASPLGPLPAIEFEGHIDYQAGAQTLLNCDTPVCGGGLGGSVSFACTPLTESTLTMREIPDLPDLTLRHARISWSASGGVNASIDQQVTLTAPNGDPFSITADEAISESFQDGMPNCQSLIPLLCSEAPADLSCDLQFYANHADITQDLQGYLASRGPLNGDWLLSDIEIAGSAISDRETAIAAVGSLTIGAWSLLLIYESPTLTSKKIYYYQGLELNEGINRQLFPSGFVAPPDPTLDLTLMVLEGDEGIVGDQLLVNQRQVSDQCNPANNVFNSTVNVNGECERNVTGVDLDRFTINGGISEGDTEASLELVIPQGNGFTTAGEQLFTHWLVLAFDHLLPDFDRLKLEKLSTPISGATVDPSSLITYEITVQNLGQAPATAVVLQDGTPQGTLYVEASARVNDLPIDDGPNGSNPFAAGLELTSLPQVGERVEIGESHQVRFQVRVSSDAEVGALIENTAQINADRIDPVFTNTTQHTVSGATSPQGGAMGGQEPTGGVEMSGVEIGGGEVSGAEVPPMGGDQRPTGGDPYVDQWDPEVDMMIDEGGTSSPPAGGSVPEMYCGEGTRFNPESGLCESLCGAGLRWDSTCDPGQCVQESQPPCQDLEIGKASASEGCASVSTSRARLTSIFDLIFMTLLGLLSWAFSSRRRRVLP